MTRRHDATDDGTNDYTDEYGMGCFFVLFPVASCRRAASRGGDITTRRTRAQCNGKWKGRLDGTTRRHDTKGSFVQKTPRGQGVRYRFVTFAKV